MATGKKSFILYVDFISVFEHLSDREAGILIKHIFKYVNDKNPQLNNKLLKLAFEPIKQHLKRDLKKWDNYIEKQKVNGKKGGRPKNPKEPNETQKTQAFFEKPKKADNVNVSVNVSERENARASFHESEEMRKRPLAECLGLAIADTGWISRNQTNQRELEDFNTYLLKIGDDRKTIKDYKRHFANLKTSNPKKINGSAPAVEMEGLPKRYKRLNS